MKMIGNVVIVVVLVAVGVFLYFNQINKPAEAPRAAAQTPVPAPVVEPSDPGAGTDLHRQLTSVYQRKVLNPAYILWKNRPGIPSTPANVPEEETIKSLRSRIAAAAVVPDEGMAFGIPAVSSRPPRIDGRLDRGEWREATELPMETERTGTRLFAVSDGKYLYLGCDVPKDTTGSGYDQFRFYFHVNLTPSIVNERVHVGPGSNDILGGIRQTNVIWTGPPPANENERWKKYSISDWMIFQKARGRAGMAPHRQYEAAIELEEAGLHVGVPFSGMAVVETDPAKRPDGKFDHRVYLGELGSQGAPAWFIINPATTTKI